MKIFKYLILLVSLSVVMTGCEKEFLDTEPASSISAEQVAETPAANEALVNGIYANLRTYGVGGTTAHTDYGHRGITAGLDNMSNDVVLNNFNWYIFFYNYTGRVQTSSRASLIWNTYYSVVADANIVINGLGTLENRTAEEDALFGQALALKSFALFNLVRIYSPSYIGNESAPGVPVPDRLTFDGKGRGTVQDVYNQIIPDLEQAVTLLEGFNRSSKQQIDQSVAQGLLAEVYLETGNWAEAASAANAARTGYGLMTGEEYVNDGFDNIGNQEWMWGADIDSESSTVYASFFSHYDSFLGGYAGALDGYKLIDANLYSMIPETDARKDVFVEAGNEFGFPPLSNTKFVDATSSFEGDYLYMRSAEMYLIEAEALVRAGQVDAGIDVLVELVSSRDSGYERPALTGQALLDEIYLQRRIELWGEGFAWFDLKRLSKPLDRTYEGSNHRDFGKFMFPAGSNEFLFQIPEDELNSNDNIGAGDQNPS
ncbi:RagB/SusD family nutrient uptake outer membrane protein [Salegentibacter chungangensis]|uniref:RagB/SusD family nutrient uptake outer membrane protein n=1 Tax=Salegentibacter chungangensis TaxID=1335724 RepID=A0ABW3NKF1_9FLAO